MIQVKYLRVGWRRPWIAYTLEDGGGMLACASGWTKGQARRALHLELDKLLDGLEP